MQLELPSRVGLVFLPFLAEKAQVGSPRLSLVVIDGNFWTKLLNFRETFFSLVFAQIRQKTTTESEFW